MVKKTGSHTEYYLNGRKKSELILKDGKQEGYVVNYYPNGKIQNRKDGCMKEGDRILELL